MAKFDLSPFRETDDGQWQTMFVLGAKRPQGIPVFIRAARDPSAIKRWQVARLSSISFFDNFSDARAFCQKYGWYK